MAQGPVFTSADIPAGEVRSGWATETIKQGVEGWRGPGWREGLFRQGSGMGYFSRELSDGKQRVQRPGGGWHVWSPRIKTEWVGNGF